MSTPHSITHIEAAVDRWLRTYACPRCGEGRGLRLAVECACRHLLDDQSAFDALTRRRIEHIEFRRERAADLRDDWTKGVL